MASVNFLLLLGLCCAVSLLPAGVNCQNGLTQGEKDAVLALHNKLRGEVTNPPAADMQVMVWNDNLAALAQNYADRCIFKHNSARHTQQTDFRFVGENLYASSAQPANYDSFIRGWYNEEQDYTYRTKSCASGKQCGHYTQVVWAKSAELGCGVKRCTSPGLQIGADNRANWIVMVCNYGPTGNFNNEFPYVAGPACSACPADKQRCVSNLCTPSSAPTEPPSSSFSTARPTTPSPRPTTPTKATPKPTIATPKPTESESVQSMRGVVNAEIRKIEMILNMLSRRRGGGRRRVVIRRRFG